ncbi:MAG: tRNA(Ile)(2)-agmatinylcytidine synthase [Methanobrevibacter sp.]|jgi:tRNA(Ile2)-agmatinylcytidine synthase|nr:tRNA(Ile)(2)-agmatinylcytidine synthase [Methanobrevibacter sp.]
MCTTYLGWKIIEELKENKIEIDGFPRLIRLNPFVRFKTRGNGAVSFKIAIDEKDTKKIDLIKKIVLKNIKELSELDCENTNPGVVFYIGDITEEMINYSMKAIHSILTIEDAEKLSKKINAEIYKIKKGRGIIGSLAAISCHLNDFTYEILTYRLSKNYGKKRKINKKSIYKMNEKTYPLTFENIDGKYIAIEPHTSCPILYGIRGENMDILKIAKDIVEVEEEIKGSIIYKTNQHTDIHIQKADKISNMEKYACYSVSGYLKNDPHVIEGGHVFFTLKDKSGEIEAAAYEPTKNFRKIIKKLIKGDQIKLFGGIGCGGTFNIEKIKILDLNKKIKYENPKCHCGKKMTSAGLNKGFKCKKCGFKDPNSKKIAIEEKRDLEEKFYETPVMARRHLAKPLIRMKNLNDN